ncbi:MAG: rubredoxin [Promethearchaeota archaeon]
MAQYRCSVCGYVYDEDVQDLPWDQLPNDWICPICGVGKDAFNRV